MGMGKIIIKSGKVLIGRVQKLSRTMRMSDIKNIQDLRRAYSSNKKDINKLKRSISGFNKAMQPVYHGARILYYGQKLTKDEPNQEQLSDKSESQGTPIQEQNNYDYENSYIDTENSSDELEQDDMEQDDFIQEDDEDIEKEDSNIIEFNGKEYNLDTLENLSTALELGLTVAGQPHFALLLSGATTISVYMLKKAYGKKFNEDQTPENEESLDNIKKKIGRLSKEGLILSREELNENPQAYMDMFNEKYKEQEIKEKQAKLMEQMQFQQKANRNTYKENDDFER